MWGVKPKEDHEVENLTKEELESEMQKDPNVQKTAEATGTTIRTPEEFGPDPEVLRNKAARLAFKKKQKRKRIGIIVGVLAIVAVIAIGTVVALSGGGGRRWRGRGTGRMEEMGLLQQLQRILQQPDHSESQMWRIRKSFVKKYSSLRSFDFDDPNQLVFAVCQPDQGKSVFTCRGNGDVLNVNGFCVC